MIPAVAAVVNLLGKQLVQDIAADLVRQVSASASGLNVTATVELDLSNLRKLSKEARKAVYRAVQRAAKPVREAVIGEALRVKKFGHLAKSIGTKTKIKKGVIYTVIGPKMSFKRKKQGRKLGTIVGDQGRDRRGRFTQKVAFDVRNKTREIVPYRYAWILEYGLGGRFKFLEPAMRKSGHRFKKNVMREITAELKKVNSAE